MAYSKTDLTIPAHWEYLIKKYVKKTFFAGTRKESFADKPEFTEGDYRFFARGIRELSTAFTQERHHLPKNYLNQKEYRSGYILYFLPVNALKVATLLQKTRALPTPRKNISLHFLDLGCGPGTALMGTLHAIEESWLAAKAPEKRETPETIDLQWTLVDQNRLILQDAQAFHDSLLDEMRKKYPGTKMTSTVRLMTGNLFSQKLHQVIPNQKYDLVFALNFLNEFPREKQLHLIDGLTRNYLADADPESGKIFLMEPALQLTTRDLMRLHDDLLAHEVVSVLSPCLHQKACPMLAENKRDWCHTYIDWKIPDWIAKLDHLAGIKKEYLKCSYLLLGRKPENHPSNEWRVVSGPLNSKGKTERLLCGPGNLPHLLRAMRQDKDESPQNKAFNFLERGDLVQVPKQPRIGKDTVVKRLDRFS